MQNFVRFIEKFGLKNTEYIEYIYVSRQTENRSIMNGMVVMYLNANYMICGREEENIT